MTNTISTQIKKPGHTNELMDRCTALNQWAVELEQVASNPDDGTASLLAGRAVMLVNRDPLDAENLLNHVAIKAGMSFSKFTAQEFNECLLGKELLRQDRSPLMALVPIECFMPANEGLCTANKADGLLPTFREFYEFLHSLNLIAPVVLVVHGPKFTDIALHLRSQTAFDRHFVIQKPTAIERASELIRRIKAENFDSSVTHNLDKLGTILNVSFADERRMGLLQMAILRLLRERGRKIHIRDLVYFAARGTVHTQESVYKRKSDLYRIAVHEAGHVIAAMIDSDGKNIPDYVSIMSGNGFAGVTLESHDYICEKWDVDTYAYWRKSVRIGLGGRAAEEFMLGAEQVGVSTLGSDLSDVSSHVRVGMAAHGISLEMELNNTSSNLAAVVGHETASEAAHTESMTRQYIEMQYLHVLSVMRMNQPLLESVIENLMIHKSLFQEDLAAIYNRVKVRQGADLPLNLISNTTNSKEAA